MHAADISPVPPDERRQSPVDLFVIFAGANIVATTLQVGAALATDFSPPAAVVLICAGATAGSMLIAALTVMGPRLGVPSVIAARAALGVRGAALVAGLLYLTNFAWIAVNNVIAASVASRFLGGPESMSAWVVALGLVSTAVVALGPRVTVALNGRQVVDADLTEHMDKATEHPGLKRRSGHIGLQCHGDRVEYRNIMLRELEWSESNDGN